MSTVKLFQSLTALERGNRRNRYLAERNALDLLEINLKEQEKDKDEFLVTRKNDYSALSKQLTDPNITQEEIDNVKKTMNLLEKQGSQSEYSDDILYQSQERFYRSNINEMIEDTEDEFAWRGELSNIVTSLDNLHKGDAGTNNAGKFRPDQARDILNNMSNLRARRAGENKERDLALDRLYTVGTQRSYVENQLAKYSAYTPEEWKELEPAPGIQSFTKGMVAEAEDARNVGDYTLAYNILQKAIGVDTKTAIQIEKNQKTPGEIQAEYDESVRQSFIQNTRAGGTNPVEKEQLGESFYNKHKQFVDYPTTKGNFNLNPGEIDRRFRILTDMIIESDNIGGTGLGGWVGGNALKQHRKAFGDNQAAYAGIMAGWIVKGKGKANYNYADGTPYMKNGVIQEGKAIGEYNMPMTKTVEENIRLNVSKVIYDVDGLGSENGELSYIQDVMAGDARAYLTTLPKWVDNEWVEPEQTEEEAAQHIKDKEALRQVKVKEANRTFGVKSTELESAMAEKQALIDKVRATKSIYSDKEKYSDKRIEGISNDIGGKKKEFRKLNTKIKLLEEEIKDLQKVLGDDLSEDYNDTAEARDIVNTIQPLSLT